MLGVRRRGFQVTRSPAPAAMALTALQPGVNTDPPVGALYNGFDIDIHAAPTLLGSGDGSSPTQARALIEVMSSSLITPGTNIGLITANGAGSYTGAANDTRWAPVFRPAHNGTAANPIRYVCKYPAARNRSAPSLFSEFRLSNPIPVPSPDNNPVLGVDQAFGDHVHFIGMYANQLFAPPRPSNGTFLISPGRTGVLFEDVWLEQTVNTSVPSDNWDSFYLEGCTNPILRRCYVSGGAGAGNHNYSAVTTYGVIGFLFEYLEFLNVNQGIFIKGSHNTNIWNSGTIRYCKSKNHSVAMVDIAEVDTDPVIVQQCLSIGGTAGVRLVSDGSSVRQINKHVIGCTIVGFAPDGGLAGGVTAGGGAMTGYLLKNNLVQQASGSHHLVDYQGSSTAGTSPLDYNHYHKQSGAATFQQLGSGGLTLAQWRTATGKDTNATEGDPLFVEPSSDNYHLQVGSPALTGSDVGGPRGCYITGAETIGVS